MLESKIKKLIQLQINPIFWYPIAYSGIEISTADIDYLTNTIQKHPASKFLINPQHYENDTERENRLINRIVFFEIFYNDAKCPENIREILFFIIGQDRADIFVSETKFAKRVRKTFNFRYNYVRQWIENIR
jgi:hypothetical protein